MSRRSKTGLFLGLLFLGTQSMSMLFLIHPIKIKKFLEYKGRHNKRYYEQDDFCDAMLWNYASYERAPWNVERMWKKCIAAYKRMRNINYTNYTHKDMKDMKLFVQVCREIRECIETEFDRLAEHNKQVLEKKMLACMSEREIIECIYDAIAVRNVPWSQHHYFIYPELVINHLELSSKKEDVSKKYHNIENAYQLIKTVGQAVASFFDPALMQARFEQKDEALERETDYFIFMRKDGESGNVDLVSMPGYKQETLYQDEKLHKELLRAQFQNSIFNKHSDVGMGSVLRVLRYYFLLAVPKIYKKYHPLTMAKWHEPFANRISQNDKIVNQMQELACPEPKDFYQQKIYSQDMLHDIHMQQCDRLYQKLKAKKK